MNTAEKIDTPNWLTIAEKELGIHETPGIENTARIVEYHQLTRLKATDDETPWCSAFINWVMNRAGFEGTESAVAKSWLGWGVSLKVPAFGCVVVLSRGHKWQGHVGFYIGSPSPDTIRVLGGNQGDKVSIQNFPKSLVLGYRWPGP